MPEKPYKKKHMTSFQLIIMGFAGSAVSAVQVIHVQAAAPVIVPAAQAAVECISNQEVELSWQMQLSSLLFSLLWYLPEKAHTNT